jgi:hypothetical protein
MEGSWKGGRERGMTYSEAIVPSNVFSTVDCFNCVDESVFMSSPILFAKRKRERKKVRKWGGNCCISPSLPSLLGSRENLQTTLLNYLLGPFSFYKK